MYYVCHNTHILVKGKMKKDEKNEEKKTHEPLVLCDILAFKTETS